MVKSQFHGFHESVELSESVEINLQSVEHYIHEDAAPPPLLPKSRAMAQKKRTFTGFLALYGRSRAIEK